MLHKKLNVTETGSIVNDTAQSGVAAAGAAMTLLGQNQRESQRPMGPILAPKQQTTIGCWNVGTMAEATRTAQVAKEMADHGTEVLGISETRWKGMGLATLQSSVKVVYVGDEEVQQGGVAIMISARAKRALMEWTPISKRIIKARFYSKYKKLTVIQTYAATNDAVDEEKDEFYNQLQDTISSCNRHDMIVLMDDLNAKIRGNNANREEVMGRFGVGVMNDNGARLCDF